MLAVFASRGPVAEVITSNDKSTELKASYMVYQEGGLTVLKNCTSDLIEIQDSNSSLVIQSAIDRLKSHGGTIYIRSGVYRNVSVHIDQDCITLLGDGWDGSYPYSYKGTVFMGNRTTHQPVISIEAAAGKRVDSIVIRDISFDGSSNDPAMNGADYGGIHMNVTTRITIDHCMFYGLKREAIYAYNCYGLNILDTTVSHSGSSIELGAPINAAAIEITGGENDALSTAVEIVRTSVVYSKWIGISTNSIGDSLNIISGYFDSGQTSNGTWFPTYAQVKANGITSIDQSVFYNSKRYLVELNGQNGKLTNSYLMMSRSGGAIGVYSYGGSGLVITGNTITGGIKHGIMMAGVDDSRITDNIISGAGDAGVYLAFCDHLTVSNNVIKNCGQEPAKPIFGAGLVLWGTNHTIVNANNIYDNQAKKTQTRGLVEDGPGDYNIITNNDFMGNLGASSIQGAHTLCKDNLGLVPSTGGTATVTGNTTTLTIVHGLGYSPQSVTVTPSQTGQGTYYISAKDDRTFTITFANPPGDAIWTFNWVA